VATVISRSTIPLALRRVFRPAGGAEYEWVCAQLGARPMQVGPLFPGGPFKCIAKHAHGAVQLALSRACRAVSRFDEPVMMTVALRAAASSQELNPFVFFNSDTQAERHFPRRMTRTTPLNMDMTGRVCMKSRQAMN
jgi:hypothetical protein